MILWFKYRISFGFEAWPWPSRGHPHQNSQGWPAKKIRSNNMTINGQNRLRFIYLNTVDLKFWLKIWTCLDRIVKVFHHWLLSIKLNGSIVHNGFGPFKNATWPVNSRLWTFIIALDYRVLILGVKLVRKGLKRPWNGR